jgi:serine phosphatase RsbU (regulator of sigma subunit)/FixJ family two-component response regulator/anti-sigma regulatory factor (Ser/Thr protein kinase)
VTEQVSILLVDDQPENLLALEAVLEPLGQRLVRAASGEQALREVLHQDFALILLDVRMPGIDGLQTARYISGRERSRRTPIIFLTGQDADFEQVFRGYEVGAVDYVVKPFEPNVLRSKVSVFVDLHRERAERIREARARAEAEAVTATVHRLQSISDVALAHLDIDELLPPLVEQLAALVDADTGGLLLSEDDGATMTLAATHGRRREDVGAVVSGEEGVLARALAHRAPLILPDASLHPALRQAGVHALLTAPLLSHDQLLGLIYVGSSRPGHFSAEDAVLMGLSAERASIAIDHARSYERERSLVSVLQRSLLPEHLPQLPRLETAARYVPSESAAAVGGDWYDAILLPDGCVGLAIGDVVGHGVRAATVMGELRNCLRAYVGEGHQPAAAVERLNELVQGTHGETMVATLAFMSIDPQEGRGCLVSAGHLPPLLLTASGEARYLESGRRPPLGVSSPVTLEPSEVQISPGSTLLFFTDGLIERRGQSIDVGLDNLRQAALAGPHDLDDLCTHILSWLQPGSPSRDDMALLAARLIDPQLERAALRLVAEPESVGVARRELARLLREAGALPLEIFELSVALSEACANAIEHAYGPGDHEFDVELEVVGQAVTVVVRDDGRWRAPRGRDRGRGLILIEQFSDAFDIERSPQGTTVRIHKRLGGAAAPAPEEASDP